MVLNRALIVQGRRKGLLWDELAPLGTAGWDCCGPTCPLCTPLPRRRFPKHLPTVMDEHHPDHQPHQSPYGASAPLLPLQGVSLGEGTELEGKAGSHGAALPFSAVYKGPFPEGITMCTKGPQPHTLPTLLHSRALPRCSQGGCMGQSEIQQSPKSPSMPCTEWQHPGHAKAPETSAFLLSSPSTITCMSRLPSQHMVHSTP